LANLHKISTLKNLIPSILQTAPSFVNLTPWFKGCGDESLTALEFFEFTILLQWQNDPFIESCCGKV
jgi:hypothetical protein